MKRELQEAAKEPVNIRQVMTIPWSLEIAFSKIDVANGKDEISSLIKNKRMQVDKWENQEVSNNLWTQLIDFIVWITDWKWGTQGWCCVLRHCHSAQHFEPWVMRNAAKGKVGFTSVVLSLCSSEG